MEIYEFQQTELGVQPVKGILICSFRISYF